MDLNYLYHRQQISLMLADNAGSVEARCAHLALARAYRSMITKFRESRRAA